MKILVVEDDPGIAEVLAYALQNDGHEVVHVTLGNEAVARATSADCVILDVGLPDIDGFETCRRIRRTSDLPILFLTSRSDEIDRVVGLEIGGDDYLTKPFSTRELLARIKAIMRRLHPEREALPPSGIVLDADKRTVQRAGRPIDLSRLEFELLTVLAAHPGRVFSRDRILDLAWPDGGCVTDRTVDAHIKTLRKKLGEPDAIETVRGIGYRFREATS